MQWNSLYLMRALESWASAWSSIFQLTSKSSIQWGGLKKLVSTKYYWKVTQVYQRHISNQVAVPVPFSNLFQLRQSWKRKPTLGSCTRSPECRRYSDVLLSWSKKNKLTRKTNQNNFILCWWMIYTYVTNICIYSLFCFCLICLTQPKLMTNVPSRVERFWLYEQ